MKGLDKHLTEAPNTREKKIQEFMNKMPYHVGSGKSYNEIMLKAIQFGYKLKEEELRLEEMENITMDKNTKLSNFDATDYV